MVALDLRDLAKYPFLKEAQSFIAANTASLDRYLESSAGHLAVKEAYDTVSASIRLVLMVVYLLWNAEYRRRKHDQGITSLQEIW